jgi:hypothetical protein
MEHGGLRSSGTSESRAAAEPGGSAADDDPAAVAAEILMCRELRIKTDRVEFRALLDDARMLLAAQLDTSAPSATPAGARRLSAPSALNPRRADGAGHASEVRP